MYFWEKIYNAMLKIKDYLSFTSLVFSFTPNYNNLFMVQGPGECHFTTVH